MALTPFAENLQTAEKQLGNFTPEQQQTLMLRAGFADVCNILDRILKAVENGNRIAARTVREANVEE